MLKITSLISVILLILHHADASAFGVDFPNMENKINLLEYCKYDADNVVEKLWDNYIKCDARTYLQMVHAQLSLFWLTNQPSDNYLLKVAYSFYKIKKDPLYSKLNHRTKELLEAAIQNLPTSLQYLFDKREFCLLNSKFTEMLLQSTSYKINNNTIESFSYLGAKNYIDTQGIIIPHFEDSIDDGISEVNIGLQGKLYRGFYNRQPDYDHQIGANFTAQYLQNYMWNTKLVDGNLLAFKQGDYVMCATTVSTKDANYRVIFGLKNKTIHDTDCQWSAGECDRR